MFGRLLSWYTVYTFLGAVAPNGILLGAKFILHPSLAFSYIGRVTAPHSSSGHEPNFAAWSRNGIMELSLLIILNRGCHLYSEGGHHVEHRPTF